MIKLSSLTNLFNQFMKLASTVFKNLKPSKFTSVQLGKKFSSKITPHFFPYNSKNVVKKAAVSKSIFFKETYSNIMDKVIYSNKKWVWGSSIFMGALGVGAIYKWFIENPDSVDRDNSSDVILTEAVINDDVIGVKKILQENPNLNLTKFIFIYIANLEKMKLYGKYEVFKVLVEKRRSVKIDLLDKIIKLCQEKYSDMSFALSNFSQDEMSHLKKHVEDARQEVNNLSKQLHQKIQAISLKNSNWREVEFEQSEVENLKEFLVKRQERDLSTKILSEREVSTSECYKKILGESPQFSKTHINQYEGHLNDREGTFTNEKGKQESFEFIKREICLKIRLYNHFKMFFKLSEKNLQIPSDEANFLKNLVKKEILILIETIMAAKIDKAAKRISHLTKNTEIYSFIANNRYENLKNFKPGTEHVYQTGWAFRNGWWNTLYKIADRLPVPDKINDYFKDSFLQHHCAYVAITRDEYNLIFRMYNVGHGVEKHTCYSDNSGEKCQPYLIQHMPFESLEKNKDEIENFLFLISQPSRGQIEKHNKIYNFFRRDDDKANKNIDSEWAYSPKQKVNNCVLAGYLVGVRVRLGKKNYDRVFDIENSLYGFHMPNSELTPSFDTDKISSYVDNFPKLGG